jgi:hypothetical protein
MNSPSKKSPIKSRMSPIKMRADSPTRDRPSFDNRITPTVKANNIIVEDYNN